MDTKMQENWTDAQLKYAQFLARNKTNRNGEKKTEGEFAKAIGVDFSTLWRWKHSDGWAELLYNESLKHLATNLPALNAAMMGKAAGRKEYKNASEAAYRTLVQQYSLLKADKIDHTTNGRDMPAPILNASSQE